MDKVKIGIIGGSGLYAMEAWTQVRTVKVTTPLASEGPLAAEIAATSTRLAALLDAAGPRGDRGRLCRQALAEAEALTNRAAAVRRAVHGDEVSLCGITNAKSGLCPEDCGFCSQSAHFAGAEAPVYGLLDADEIVEQAKAAEAAGAREFSIVTSGPRIARERELRTLEAAIRRIRAETTPEPCASLGLMRRPELERLKRAGLLHYHHNLETAPSHFAKVCTTHSFEEQLETIRTAKELGFRLCTGGILGMGETPDQRVELAEALRDLDVDCVPLNFLNPRPGTPMASVRAITAEECLAALWREGAAAVGVNCVAAGARLAALVARAAPRVGVPIAVKPNAGSPGALVGPEAFAAATWGALRAGARLAGGCCGAGTEHLRALGAAARRA